MRPVNIAIVSDSAIIAAGVAALLREIHSPSVGTVTTAGSANMIDELSRRAPRLVIVDTLAAGTDALDNLRNALPTTTRFLLIINSVVPAALSDPFDYKFSLYDSPAKLADIIADLSATPTDEADPSKTLSQREKEVVIAIVKGMSNKEIAAEMHVSVNTVMTHRRNIASKLQIHSPAALTIYAIVTRLVRLSDLSPTLPTS